MVKCSIWVVGLIAIYLCSSLTQGKSGKDAYVTLQYGEFLLGARVLGQSILETGTKKDLVALCTESVPDKTKRILEADGWKIRPIKSIENPIGGPGSYFSGIYSKLLIWNMTDYERILYLDSDALVLSNIDHMFDCGTFCATYRHSDLFNAGVLVVEPSKHVFNELVKIIPRPPTFGPGEQGLLNDYFRDLRYAPMFNWSDNTRQQRPMRLPAGLNTDTVTYYLKSKWWIPPEELKVIHYTIGPVSKPWVWWTTYVFDLNWQWNEMRERLPEHNEYEDHSTILRWVTLSLPYPFLLAFFTLLRFSSYWGSFKFILLTHRVLVNNSFSKHISPLVFLLLSYYLTYALIVPTTMIPSHAKYVFSLWSHSFLIVFFGIYCHVCYVTDNYNNTYAISQKKMHTFKLYMMFVASYILLGVVPPLVVTFSLRVLAILLLGVLHVAFSHIVGQQVIRTWSKLPVRARMKYSMDI